MAVRSRKNQNVKPVACIPERGLDLSTSATAIHDNALTRAYNVWYEPAMQGLVTRYGLELVDVPPLPYPISLLHYHVMNDGTGYMLACTATNISADALYRLDESGSTKAWVKILDLETKGGNAPSLLSFNGVLLIADGRNGGIVAWDGSTINEIQGSPSRPTVLTSIADRVVSNGLGSPDAVFFSEPEDYTGWSVSSGGAALIIPAGFGDGMTINAMTSLYGVLVVSKVHTDSLGNITHKKLHMIAALGTPSSWAGVQLSQTSSAAAPYAMTGVADKVYFLDNDGPQSLIPSPGGAFGDVAIDSKLAPKVLPLIAGASRRCTQAAVQWVRNLAQLWYIVRSGAAATVAVYHPLQGSGVWTELQFPIAPRSLCEVGNRVYMAGDDGRLYMLAPTGKDWTPEGDKEIFATVRTKKYEQMGGDVILKAVKVGVRRVLPTNIRVEAVDDDGGRYLVAETTTLKTGSADQKIYDAGDKIANANWKIYGGDVAVPQYFDWKTTVRKSALSLQVRTIGGRVVIENISGLIAVVG